MSQSPYIAHLCMECSPYTVYPVSYCVTDAQGRARHYKDVYTCSVCGATDSPGYSHVSLLESEDDGTPQLGGKLPLEGHSLITNRK